MNPTAHQGNSERKKNYLNPFLLLHFTSIFRGMRALRIYFSFVFSAALPPSHRCYHCYCFAAKRRVDEMATRSRLVFSSLSLLSSFLWLKLAYKTNRYWIQQFRLYVKDRFRFDWRCVARFFFHTLKSSSLRSNGNNALKFICSLYTHTGLLYKEYYLCPGQKVK